MSAKEFSIEEYVSKRWKIRQFDLPNADKYLYDLENIVMADVGIIDALESNLFFQESCQMIANSIYLFQRGFFDAAFYSIRQAIETSLGSLFLSANPDKMKEWKRLNHGFELGKLASFLKEKEPVFMDMTSKMKSYFEHIREVQKRTNKYVHKQGFLSFYSIQHYQSSDQREERIYKRIVRDFEIALREAIGAVATYRLAIDPLPVLLMDEDIQRRSMDFITEPYSEDFVNTYIGFEVLEAYKTTDIYQSYEKDLSAREEQNDATYDLIHYQIIDRRKIGDIMNQMHLLSLYDRMAVVFAVVSSKIAYIIVNGWLMYVTEADRKYQEYVMGESYYSEFFNGENNLNIKYRENAFLSRVRVRNEYIYIESNEPLVEEEMKLLKETAEEFSRFMSRQESEIRDLLKENGIEYDSGKTSEVRGLEYS